MNTLLSRSPFRVQYLHPFNAADSSASVVWGIHGWPFSLVKIVLVVLDQRETFHTESTTAQFQHRSIASSNCVMSNTASKPASYLPPQVKKKIRNPFSNRYCVVVFFFFPVTSHWILHVCDELSLKQVCDCVLTSTRTFVFLNYLQRSPLLLVVEVTHEWPTCQ